MKKGICLTSIVMALSIIPLRGIEANADQFYQRSPSHIATQSSPMRPSVHSFCYDLGTERGYSVSYSVLINNDNSCRFADVNRILPGDSQLELIEMGRPYKNERLRFIPLSQFLNAKKEYQVYVVQGDGKERPLDSVKPGDLALRFYEVFPKAQAKPKGKSKVVTHSTIPVYKRDLPGGGFEVETVTPDGKRNIERFGPLKK